MGSPDARPVHPLDADEGRPLAARILRLALPLTGSSALHLLNGSLTAVWIGHYLGSLAFTAFLSASAVLGIALNLLGGQSLATNILTAQKHGARDTPAAVQSAISGLLLQLICSVVLAAVSSSASGALLDAINVPAAARETARAYLQVSTLAIPMISLLTLIADVFRAAGQGAPGFRFAAVALMLDTLLNPLLIFGVGPFPALGLSGTAFAMLMAYAASLALAVVAISRHIPARQIVAALRVPLNTHWIYWRWLLRKGPMLAIPSLAMTLSAGGIAVITNSIGPQATAALGASLQLGGYLLLPAMAIASATTTVAAQIVGHGVLEQLRTICRVGFGMCLAVTVSLLIAVLAGGATLLQWFLPEDPVAMDLAMHAHTIVLLTWVPFGCALVLIGVCRATGAVALPMVLVVVSMLFIRVPIAYWGRSVAGLDALWWSFPISAVVVLAGAAICFRRSIPAGR